MANYNKIILVGNLTRDPQMSYLPNQTPVVEIGLAVNRRWKSQDGQQKEDTCFIDCRCYGRQAEVLNQYVRKGNPLLVEGRLQFDQWEAKDGSKRSKHRVFIERFQFLGAKPSGGGAPGGGYSQERQYSSPPSAPQQNDYSSGGGYDSASQPPSGSPQPPQADHQIDGGGEDIPF